MKLLFYWSLVLTAEYLSLCFFCFYYGKGSTSRLQNFCVTVTWMRRQCLGGSFTVTEVLMISLSKGGEHAAAVWVHIIQKPRQADVRSATFRHRTEHLNTKSLKQKRQTAVKLRNTRWQTCPHEHCCKSKLSVWIINLVGVYSGSQRRFRDLL